MLMAKTIPRAAVWSVILLMIVVGFSAWSESQPIPKQKKPVTEQTALPINLEELFVKLTPTGWKIFDNVKRFTADNLYQHINGRAEFYISYNFTNMTFVNYVNKSDTEQFIDLSVYDMGNPTNAYGVFSVERSKGHPSLHLGRDSYRADTSYFIWKGQYYIRIIASNGKEELQHSSVNLAKKITESLDDLGEPVWGLTVLTEIGVVPESIHYFRVNAMGLEFMSNTYMAQYSKDSKTITVFLSQRNYVSAAGDTVNQYIEFAKEFGRGIERIKLDGQEAFLCNMDEGYDIVFQKDRLVGGVTSVENRNLAISVVTDLFISLHNQ